MARKLQIDLGGVQVTARLLTDRAPKTAEALGRLGTVSGIARHAKWAGPAFYLQSDAPELAQLPLENRAHLLAPGAVVWAPTLGEFMVAYDDARLYDGATGGTHGTVVAEIDGDLAALGDQAYKLRSEGEKPLTMRVVEE